MDKPKRPKEMTLEELIEKEAQNLEKSKQTTQSHIQKLTERMVGASEEETKRLQSLVDLHVSHLSVLNDTDPAVAATEKFEKFQSKK